MKNSSHSSIRECLDHSTTNWPSVGLTACWRNSKVIPSTKKTTKSRWRNISTWSMRPRYWKKILTQTTTLSPSSWCDKKGSRKLRIVFDSAASYQGRCLNDAFLSEPSWQTQLPSVLIRFIERQAAYAKDIEAMFSKIRLRPENAVYHRFLWKEEGSEHPIICQMNRLSFGDKCSPFVAIATTRRAADDHGARKPEVVKAIKENMYMDDYLNTATTLDEAVNRAKEATRILAKRDFHFQWWTSNALAFSTALNPTIELPTSSEIPVLGINWHTKPGRLSLVLNTADKIKFNRIGITSLVTEIFDPLVFAAPFRKKKFHFSLPRHVSRWKKLFLIWK